MLDTLNAKKECHQCPLHNESRLSTTFITPLEDSSTLGLLMVLCPSLNRCMTKAFINLGEFQHIVNHYFHIFDSAQHAASDRVFLQWCTDKQIALNIDNAFSFKLLSLLQAFSFSEMTIRLTSLSLMLSQVFQHPIINLQSNRKAEATVKSVKKLLHTYWIARSLDHVKSSVEPYYCNTPNRKDGLPMFKNCPCTPLSYHPSSCTSIRSEWHCNSRATAARLPGIICYLLQSTCPFPVRHCY